MTVEVDIELNRERIVSANLAERVGQLMRENITLLVRIAELEAAATNGDGGES